MVEILDYIDPQAMFLMLIFLISFVMLQFSLSRVFKKSPQTGSMLAVLISILITYGLYYMGVDFEGFAFDLGFDMDMVIMVSSVLILIGFIYLLKKVGLGLTLIILGIGIIGISFFAYEQTITATIGIVLLLIGILLWWRRKKKLNKFPNINQKFSAPKTIKNPGRKLGMSLFFITIGGIVLVGGLILGNIVVSVGGGALLLLGIIVYMAGGVFHLWDNKQGPQNFYDNSRAKKERKMYEEQQREFQKSQKDYQKRQEETQRIAGEQRNRMKSAEYGALEKARKENEEQQRKEFQKAQIREEEKRREQIEKYKQQLRKIYSEREKYLKQSMKTLEDYKKQKRSLQQSQKDFPTAPLRREIEKVDSIILKANQQIRTLTGELEEITRRLNQYK